MKEQLDKLKAQFEHLNNRERVMVGAAAIALLVYLPYQFIWSPIVGKVEAKQMMVEKQQRDLVWMQSKQNEVRQLSRSSSRINTKGKSIYGIVEKTAQQRFGGDIRIQQEGKKGIRIQIKQASFDAVMLWLDNLQLRHKINIKDLKIDNSKIIGQVRASILVQG